MTKQITIFILLLTCNACFGQSGFSEFLNYLNSLPYNQKDIVVDSFFAASSENGIPLVEGNTVYFLYMGESKHVLVTGNFNNWNKDSLVPVPGTEMLYLKCELPLDAGTSYLIKEENGIWHADIFNTNSKFQEEKLTVSILRMPAYIEYREINHIDKITYGDDKSRNSNLKFIKKQYDLPFYSPLYYEN